MQHQFNAYRRECAARRTVTHYLYGCIRQVTKVVIVRVNSGLRYAWCMTFAYHPPAMNFVAYLNQPRHDHRHPHPPNPPHKYTNKRWK